MKRLAIGNLTQLINLKTKMKHTDLYNEYKKLDAIEREELIAAVNAHGGEYVFIHIDEDGDYDSEEQSDAPIVAASTRYMDAYEDFYISRVEVKNGHLYIYGWPTERVADEDEIENVAHGHLGYITDMIDETETVKDVSTSAFAPQPILVFSREDVENVGYIQDMTPEQYKELVTAMKKSYEWNMDIYWDALKQACENVGITSLNASEDDEED